MFNCSYCKKSITVNSIDDLTEHLYFHRFLGNIKFPFHCCQGNCQSSIESTIPSFIKHFRRYHYADVEINSIQFNQPCPSVDIIDKNSNMEIDGMCPSLPSSPEPPDSFSAAATAPSSFQIIAELKESLKDEAIRIISDLRGRGNVTLKLSTYLMRFIKNIIDLIIGRIVQSIQFLFDPIPSLLFTLNESLNQLKEVFPIIATEYKVRKIIENHSLFIKPEPLALGTRYECSLSTLNSSNRPSIVRRPNNAQYVSIKKTLQLFLSNSSLYNLAFNKSDAIEGVISHFESGTRYKSNSFMSDPSKKVVLLQLYYDGLGVSNAMRGCSTIHNSGLFLFFYIESAITIQR